MVAIDLRGSPGLLAVLWATSRFVVGAVTLDPHIVPYGNLHPTRQLKRSITNITHGVGNDVVFAGFSAFLNGSLSNLNLTSACEAALYQIVFCDDATSSLMTSGYVGSFNNSTLTALVCDAGCESSIAQLHDNVLASCGQTTDLVPGLPFLGLVDMLWSNWNQSCFIDPTTGDNCNDVIAAFPNVTDLSDLPLLDLCSYCNVEKLALMQANAYTGVYDDNWESTYEYVAGACNISVADFNATASVFNVTVPSSTTNCVSGNMYTTKQGDTCDSIAQEKSVSAATMFYINPDILNCSSILAGTSLCLPLVCNNLYTVQANDTCTSIAVDAGILTQNVLSYNSQLNWNCTNLQSTNPYWGSTLCVSTPGGNYTGQALNTSTSTGSLIVNPPTGLTVAKGTTTNCGEWYANDGSLNLICVQICLAYEIAINLFTEANPSLSKTACDADLVLGDAYCTDPLTGWDWGNTSTSSNSTTSSSAALSTTTTVSSSLSLSTTSTKTTSSVTPPGPTQSGIISTCNKYYVTVSGDSCASIETAYSITFAEFYAWNPAIGSDCTNLWLDEAYCVGISGSASITTTTATTSSITPPGPTQSGIISTCTKYYVTVAGDSCASIESAYSITFAEFYAWNPAIGSDCTNLWLDEAYCVGISGSTSSTTTSSLTPPAPTQSGITSACTEYYVTVAGDSCAAIESAYSITFAEFYAWNPAIGSDCTNLWVDEAYCVSVS